MDVPPLTYVSVEITIDGSGSGSSDLDLYETDNTGNTSLQYSATEQEYERLAIHNDTNSVQTYWWAVLPYQSAAADYDLVLQVRDYHEGISCDDFFSDTSESGPCNEILQYPRAPSDDHGYEVEHQAHYSNLRLEVQYLIAWAAEEVMAEFPNTTPLSLMDMSEDDGVVPGTMVNSLRHPLGTHENGNDLDIAYYQNDGDNNGEVVCPQNDGQFCTGPPSLLDAPRTAYFMAKLFSSGNVRVIGVDTLIAPLIEDAADDLLASGAITSAERDEFDYGMASGSGWPFHHHHLHFSWNWEDGWFFNGPPLGCMTSGMQPLPRTPAIPLR